MDNNSQKISFYNKDFWGKIKNSLLIFINNKELWILWIAIWVITYIIMLIWWIFGVIWLSSLYLWKWLEAQIWDKWFLWILILIILILLFITIVIIINIISAILTILCLTNIKNNQPINLIELLNKSINELNHYIKVAIAWFMYLLIPILLVVWCIIIMIIWIASKSWWLSMIWSLWFLISLVYIIIKSFDIMFIYNIALVENKNWTDSIDKSSSIINWKKVKSFIIILVLNIIVGIIIWIIVKILWWNESNLGNFINTILQWCTWVINAIIIYFLYTEYSTDYNKTTNIENLVKNEINQTNTIPNTNPKIEDL